MAINLQELRQACLDYVRSSVTCKIENYKADVIVATSPGEGFRFDLRATNTGAMRVNRVKYHVYVTNPSVAKLIVPYMLMPIKVARSGCMEDSPALSPGQRVADMYLFPFDADRKSLDPGEADAWMNIRGIAETLGNTAIRFEVLAQVDLDYLLPINADSKETVHSLSVV